MISPTSILLGTKRANERGQISIFFASSIIVLISIIAFVINIGLFVKAKINLQNATDAGAYAGAAVQARMLNRIGYMNWEMRNNYKEWMFKYYVLGNLNISDVANPVANDNVSFRMQRDPNINNTSGDDIYNFPSVCLHYAGVPTNVCRRYAIPGIPRFEPTNLVGIDETTSSFIDAIVKEKSSDCSKRTQLNFNVTNLWAYNLLDGNPTSVFQDAPQVAVDRPGAWPKAVELAIRTRSLEYAVNRPPVTQGVCSNQGEGSPGCRSVLELAAQKHYGNERPVKAFWSAYRNLTNEGTDNNGDGQSEEEMKSSFTLTELSPTSVGPFAENSLSTLLMGPAKQNDPKFYLDLKLQLINYVTFFTALIARDDTLTSSGQTVKAEGACDVSKVAVPVPGFPLGFYKNPEVLTYYAVKGEAKFMGLFNPFGQTVKLTAWAAAKPMGGRIGPALFKPGSESTTSTRTTANNRRSTPYLSGLDLTSVPRKGTNLTVPLGTYAPGMPIPINGGSDISQRFWIDQPSDQVGGWIESPNIVFGVPNMVYDFTEGTDPNTYITAEQTNIIRPAPAINATDGFYASGLYKKSQFEEFKKNLVGTDNVQQVTRSIFNVRAPTAYEAANYTVPFANKTGISQQVDGAYTDTFGFISGRLVNDELGQRVIARLYAPLYSATNQDALFTSGPDVANEIQRFMNVQLQAMRKYRDSMNTVAKSIFNDDPVKYKEAALRISDFDLTMDPKSNDARPSCKSIAGTFLAFYFSADELTRPTDDGTACPPTLRASVEAFFNRTDAPEIFDPLSHVIEYTYREDHPRSSIAKWDDLLTGYMPGPLRGAAMNGVFATPFGTDAETMRRSGYSTKLVTLKSLTTSGHYNQASTNAAIYSEGLFTPLGEDVTQGAFRNALDLTASGVPSTVNH